MGTRNRFNPCRPCCDNFDPPCTGCDDVPPDPLPLTLDGFAEADWPYGGAACPCPDLDGSYWLEWIDTCRWAFEAEIECDCYGGECRVRIEANLSKTPGNIRWNVTVFVFYSKSYALTGAITFYFAKNFPTPPDVIDCEAHQELTYYWWTVSGSAGWPPICINPAISCAIN